MFCLVPDSNSIFFYYYLNFFYQLKSDMLRLIINDMSFTINFNLNLNLKIR